MRSRRTAPPHHLSQTRACFSRQKRCLVGTDGKMLSDGKKFARGVKKQLPQAAYIVDAQNRNILERVELERDSAFQYGRLLLDAGGVHSDQCPRHSVKKNRCWFSLAAIRLADLVPVPRCSILINGFESLPAQEERPRWQTTVSKRSFAHALRLGSD
jgi:hypothetical protein